MSKLADKIQESYKQLSDKKATEKATPGTTCKVLTKTKDLLDADDHKQYRSVVGKLMYYCQKIAPEMANAVRELAAHMDAPCREHIAKLGRTVGFVKKVRDIPLTFRKPFKLRAISQTDSNYAADSSERKSISGHLHTIGGMVTNWLSHKQKIVTMSITET